jgi:L,D-transpeptidase YcbB
VFCTTVPLGGVVTRTGLVSGLLLAALLSSAGTQGVDPASDIRRLAADNPQLRTLYEPAAYEPLWFHRDGTLRSSGRDALRLLRHAADDGLDPADYVLDGSAGAPADEHDAAAQAGTSAALDVGSRDVVLSELLLRFVGDLHVGRVDPRDIGFQLNVARNGHDIAALVQRAVAGGRLVASVYALRPRDPQYAALAAELPRYRALAARDVGAPLPVVHRVRPGEPYAGLAALWQRLVLLGDAPADLVAPDTDGVYRDDLVDAVRRFQRRHGLEPDGVLGARTFEALAVPVEWRVRQIELAMERLRWLPHQGSERLIVVNIPMFRLSAWDTIPPVGMPGFSTGVIVGKAVSTETPVFTATLNEIIFRPYWNVPRSIVRTEVLPALARDPAYFEKHDMELVAGESDHAPVVAATADNIARLRAGQVRLRQRPGPKNSLGRIKFSFPNENDVYMHATPAQALFARSRRDFSHGCVRVEDPVGLAAWVLNDPAWDRAAITAAMDASVSSRLSVRPAIRVMLLYTTAAKRFDTGELVFAPDIYGHDARLDAALRDGNG